MSFIRQLTRTNAASIRILERLGFELTHAADDVPGLPTAFFKRIRSIRSEDVC
jgi:RimJ/RimL family protein N-acetyltransferase